MYPKFANLLSFSGRAGRLEYILVSVLFFIILVIATYLILIALSSLGLKESQKDLPAFLSNIRFYWNISIALIIASSFVLIYSIIATSSVEVRRLHDLSFTGWLFLAHILILMLPSRLFIIGSAMHWIWVILLSFIPGIKEKNRYGDSLINRKIN